MAPQPICHQRHLSYSSLGRLIAGIVLSLITTASALAQQSTRFDQYELHHSIVYTTFLSPQVAAEYGIARGTDKAILTLSVRDVDLGEIAGRPMTIEGRTWDLITGGDMDIKEIRDGRATYYIIPFEFLDREYRFFKFTFQPKGAEAPFEHKIKVQLWRQG